MLRDSSIRTFEAIARELAYLREITTTAGSARAVLGNKAEVLFRSADVPDRLRGPNLSGAWFDEAGEMVEDAYLIAIACLREAGEQGWLSATFTPRGRGHWTYAVFAKGRENTALFTARTSDNPFNPEGFEDQLRGQYTSAFAEQELAGQFVDLHGTVARREWFRVVEVPPACSRRVRAWDFAATPENARGEGDYTVGALLGQYPGGWVILDMIRQRVAGGAVAGLVKRVAEQDGRGVEVVVEQEPGATGKIAAAYLTRELAGWNVRTVAPQGDKVTRAMPLLAQAEAGNVAMLRAGWNAALLDELASFPGGAHDDQVDAASHAFNRLSSGGGSTVLI
jgi:predicted phage terminase large subunit-like protein